MAILCLNRIRTLVAMATNSYPLTYNGKMKNGIYCYVTADILTYVLQKCSLSSPLPNFGIAVCQNLLILMVAMATKRQICDKIFKNHLLRNHKGDKVETVGVFIKLASIKTAFLMPLLLYFRCYGNLKFLLT